MERYATGPNNLLKLIRVDDGSGVVRWIWWDTETPLYTAYGSAAWDGENGHCKAMDWAIGRGLSLDGKSV